jgi:hypothetical protein
MLIFHVPRWRSSSLAVRVSTMPSASAMSVFDVLAGDGA